MHSSRDGHVSICYSSQVYPPLQLMYYWQSTIEFFVIKSTSDIVILQIDGVPGVVFLVVSFPTNFVKSTMYHHDKKVRIRHRLRSDPEQWCTKLRGQSNHESTIHYIHQNILHLLHTSVTYIFQNTYFTYILDWRWSHVFEETLNRWRVYLVMTSRFY
jgi:hypothetical protein